MERYHEHGADQATVDPMENSIRSKISSGKYFLAVGLRLLTVGGPPGIRKKNLLDFFGIGIGFEVLQCGDVLVLVLFLLGKLYEANRSNIKSVE